MVEVVAHNPDWSTGFASEEDRLRSGLNGLAFVAHHIGSTAVPGLPAKPIIDILVCVDDLCALDRHNASFVDLGYEVMGEFGIETRRYFRRNDDMGRRTHHVHAFTHGSHHIERHLAFRDYLRAHPDLVMKYGALKRQLLAHSPDPEDYIAGKSPFIEAQEIIALAWYKSQTGGAQPVSS
jgi:GrpB-like predicted nucleotidyltransferase (UPF0157 family)